jgi:hypothetical protein
MSKDKALSGRFHRGSLTAGGGVVNGIVAAAVTRRTAWAHKAAPSATNVLSASCRQKPTGCIEKMELPADAGSTLPLGLRCARQADRMSALRSAGLVCVAAAVTRRTAWAHKAAPSATNVLSASCRQSWRNVAGQMGLPARCRKHAAARPAMSTPSRQDVGAPVSKGLGCVAAAVTRRTAWADKAALSATNVLSASCRQNWLGVARQTELPAGCRKHAAAGPATSTPSRQDVGAPVSKLGVRSRRGDAADRLGLTRRRRPPPTCCRHLADRTDWISAERRIPGARWNSRQDAGSALPLDLRRARQADRMSALRSASIEVRRRRGDAADRLGPQGGAFRYQRAVGILPTEPAAFWRSGGFRGKMELPAGCRKRAAARPAMSTPSRQDVGAPVSQDWAA